MPVQEILCLPTHQLFEAQGLILKLIYLIFSLLFTIIHFMYSLKPSFTSSLVMLVSWNLCLSAWQFFKSNDTCLVYSVVFTTLYSFSSHFLLALVFFLVYFWFMIKDQTRTILTLQSFWWLHDHLFFVSLLIVSSIFRLVTINKDFQ